MYTYTVSDCSGICSLLVISMHVQGIHEVLVKCTIVFIVQIHFFTWCARSTKHIYSPLSWMQWVYFINSDIWVFSRLVTAAPRSEWRAPFCQILHMFMWQMAVITGYYTKWLGQQSWSMARRPKPYLQQPVIASSVIQQKQLESHRQLFRPYWGSSVWHTDGWMSDDWLFLYPPQVKHLWFQQKQIEAISQSVTVRPNRQRGLFTVAQCRHS